MKEWIGELFGVLGRNAWISHVWDTCVMTSVAILFLLLIRPLLKRLPRNVAYVLWYNPLCWAAYHFFVLDMEVSCDEAVIRRLGAQARKEYSYLLLTMADKGRHGWFQEPAFSISSVKERIVRVMRYEKPKRFISVVSVVIVLLCSCGIASNRYLAAGDNKVLVVTAEKLFGWYDLTTGECINPMEDVCKECRMTTTIAKGDGVIALTSQQNGKTLDVNVYDMDSGKLEYTIPTEVDINDWKKSQRRAFPLLCATIQSCGKSAVPVAFKGKIGYNKK